MSDEQRQQDQNAQADSTGIRWGDPISEERQAELQGYLDQWDASTDQDERMGPFDGGPATMGVRLTGADLYWLAIHNELTLDDPALNLHLEGADLRGAYLENADLTGAHLERANLQGAHLNRATLYEADLAGANLSGALLLDSVFIEARLEGATLRHAHLEGSAFRDAHLEGADLREAHLQGADLSGASLEGSDLREARLDGSTLLTNATFDSTTRLDETIPTDEMRRLDDDDQEEME